MHQRITSTLAFLGTVAAATLAAAVMSGNALAEGPIEDFRPTTGALSRDQAKAELMAQRQQLTSYASEWKLQQGATLQPASGTTRAQVRADYIAAREEVRAMNSEGGSAAFAHLPARRPVIMAGESSQH
ncbi:hypothetical protein GCM10028796_22730 [Ramlibacter monticola]|jgi:hypothetical protein|uniref:DUF4148 domain-containing protein n=1 Tax=Ramlibacter monticola TaxID=1926872 RepID=A0A937CUE0_9BURK|nr:hypothetical protein [Ramlibacter monticola]MBL0392524.1 hypothetical protein [Ramlibacter monticola]